jgi:DNA-binding response OmpR family regulator
MAGERILLVESSAGVQDMTKAVLEENGFKVIGASNALAALNHPELSRFNVILVDTGLDEVDGLEVAAQIRTEAETYSIPVLLLIPEEELDRRSSQALRGANGYIGKPYSPAALIVKVQEVLEEQRLRNQSRQYLEDSADRHMQALAEQKIQQAVEKKIQIIVERAIQSIVSIIDQRARREVDARVTALTAEKEQELVRLTVQEVARSMVEKMAERKVTEAMEAILQEQTEKTVKRAADSMLPPMIRERIREQLENQLPREVQSKVEKATADKMNEIVEAMINILQTEAKKTVPLVAKEKLPEIAERQVTAACEQRIPQLVAAEARGAVGNELNMRIKPLIDAESKKIKNQATIWVAVMGFVVLGLVVWNVFVTFGTGKG